MLKEYKTKVKDYILEYILSNRENRFSALDVYSFLQVHNEKINISTVYRNLDKLYESGVLLKFKNNRDSYFTYQYTENNTHCLKHLHIQCIKCGKIAHIDDEFMKEINEYLLKTKSFILDCESSILQGVCEICKN